MKLQSPGKENQLRSGMKGERGKRNSQLFEEVDFGPRLGFHGIDSHESSLESARYDSYVSLRIFSKPWEWKRESYLKVW